MSAGEDLRNRHAAIEMTSEEFREAGHKLVDELAEFIGSIRDYPVAHDEQPSEIRALLPRGGLPPEGSRPKDLLEEMTKLMIQHSLFNGHPRFLGYITASPAPIGALTDMLGATINPNVGGWQLSPLASEIELQALSWIAEMIGYPTDCGGIFVSGGNMANLIAFIAARQAKAPWNLRELGLDAGKGRMLVYCTTETHTWIEKATDLFGHGTQSVRRIPLDENMKADVSNLGAQIIHDRENGDHPFLIIGSGGTVGTGAVDPLSAMADIAAEHDVWFHVDGAYGALAAVLDDAPSDLKALSRADSVAVDPHKWLYSSLEAGCTLVRDREALPNAFSYRPPYYRFTEDEEPQTNFYEYGVQNSRGFRAFKVWMALRQVGRNGYAKMIADDIRLAAALYDAATADPELEAVTRALSITTFRFVPKDLAPGTKKVENYLNELNEEILSRLKKGGEAFVSNAVLNDMFVLRACVVNFRTSLEDIEAIPEIVTRVGREADKDMRAKFL